jgi:hypothetical protein
MELAWKLAKEMEEHRAKVGSRLYVPHRYGVYLCPEDADYYQGQEDVLLEQLRSHLLGHARKEGYSLTAAPEISFHVDEDLRMGQFGIATEPVDLREPRQPPTPAPAALTPSAGAAAGPPYAGPKRGSHAVVPEVPPVVLRYEGMSVRFEQAKITVGRGKEMDVRLSDPNVSRRHAVIFWDRGRLFVKDLGSTNGTLLNGHAVEHSLVRSGDVVTAGATPIAVETG